MATGEWLHRPLPRPTHLKSAGASRPSLRSPLVAWALAATDVADRARQRDGKGAG